MNEVAIEQNKALAMLRVYAHKEDRSQEDREPILQAYRQSEMGFVWELVFAMDPSLCRALFLEKSRMQARNSLRMIQEAPPAHRSEALFRMTAMLCLAETGANHEGLRTGGLFSRSVCRRIDAWKEVFSQESVFEGLLSKEMEEMSDRHRRLNPPHTHPALPHAHIFSMPVECDSRIVGEDAYSPCNQAPREILERLNDFADEYFVNLNFDLSADGRHWLILDRSPDRGPERSSNLIQALSDSYAEAAKELTVLSGNREVKPGWDASRLVPGMPSAAPSSKTGRMQP